MKLHFHYFLQNAVVDVVKNNSQLQMYCFKYVKHMSIIKSFPYILTLYWFVKIFNSDVNISISQNLV